MSSAVDLARENAADPHPRIAASGWASRALPDDVAAIPLPDHVVTFLAQGSGEQFSTFMTNPRVPLDQRLRVLEQATTKVKRLLRHVLHPGVCSVRDAVAFLPFIPAETFKTLRSNGKGPDRAYPAEVCQKAWAEGDEAARAFVAHTAYLTDGTITRAGQMPIEALAADPSPKVRRALARNQFLRGLYRQMSLTTYRVLYGLLTDADPSVRLAARRNRLHVAWSISRPAPEVLAEAAGRDTDESGLWPSWEADPDPAVRIAFLDSLRSPDDRNAAMTRLLTADTDTQIRLAKYRYVTPTVLDQLSRCPDPRVRRAVLRAAQVPSDVIARLASDPVLTVRKAAGQRLLTALGA